MPNDVEWNRATAAVTEQIVQVETEYGYGTGFVSHAAHDLRGITTAFHVIENALKKNKRILIHYRRQRTFVIGPGRSEYLLIRDKPPRSDVALLLFKKANDIQKPTVEIIEPNARIVTCTEVSWVGFPQFSRNHPCYFSGRISRVDLDDKRYLLDGAVVKGVSGAPVFCILSGKPVIIGSISKFIYLSQNKTPLPGGLSVATCTSTLIGRLKFEEASADDKRPISERVTIG